jgi:hypothetical protein
MPTPEDKARENIDRLLTQAGWAVRDQSAANILAANLDIFWLRDETLEESDNLPDPDLLAQEIVEDLEAALEQFREIAADLRANSVSEQDP